MTSHPPPPRTIGTIVIDACVAGADAAPAHYRVARDGTVAALMPEHEVADTGRALHWRGSTAVDAGAVRIVVERDGADDDPDTARYPPEQMGGVVRLVAGITDRHGITRGNVVGESDLRPAQARAPGAGFVWHMLARRRLALPRPTHNLVDPGWSEAGFLLALQRFGYDVAVPIAATAAFQRRFRPEMIDGEVDAECRMILLALLLPKPRGDD